MRVKLFSMLAGLLLTGCLFPGHVSVSGSTDGYWDGHAFVTLSSHEHRSTCGHYYYDGCWNLHPVTYVYTQPGYGRRGHGNGNGNGNGKGNGKGKGHGGSHHNGD